ncbi:hypothetical protein KIN20_000266 [Parelaphostrongylus tenuis]|uniref:Uncharacterized protein n=1 Tax=Parelaphostrongylus tenuis TaxID=148309 RepID=A0AAD5LRX4_PARTN|nr:hypothetical protein KIN20_000266 [Parelaphostrongylus tenuis]
MNDEFNESWTEFIHNNSPLEFSCMMDSLLSRQALIVPHLFDATKTFAKVTIKDMEYS